MKTIDRFVGPYSYLSNFSFSRVKITLDDQVLTCPTIEHGFQASKTLDLDRRIWVVQAPTPAIAKRRGRAVNLRPDWEDIKVDVMLDLLRQKFAFGTELGTKLLDTEDAQLIEGNSWGDRYWGTVGGQGLNTLGRCLMQVRHELQREEEDGLEDFWHDHQGAV